MKNRKFIVDTLVVGFTLFATFFGAGNLVFPPYMGILVGNQWIKAILGLALTGILVSVLSMVGVVKGGGSIQKVTKPIASWFYIIFNILTMYLIALFILIPRTGATTYEVGFRTLLPQVPHLAVLIIFFTVVYFLTVDKLGAVDKIGRYLTPTLIIMIVAIILAGIVNPLETNMSPSKIENPFAWAFSEGYQMGDLVTGLLFSSVMVMTIKHKKYSPQEGLKMTYIASAIASGLLLFIYGSLLWIGASGSSTFDPSIERTDLLSQIVKLTIGSAGQLILSITVILACLTTAVGLLTAVADFTSTLLRHRISYKVTVLIFCIFCVFQADIGVERIIGLSSPFFAVAYPIGIIVTFIGLFRQKIPNDGATKGAVLLTVIYTLIEAFAMSGIGTTYLKPIVQCVPLGAQGFGWVSVAIVGGIIGTLLWKFSHGDERGYIAED